MSISRHFIAFILPVLLLTLLCPLSNARQLNCECNIQIYCPESSCTTSAHEDSACFKKASWLKNEDGQQEIVYEYGCLSGQEGHLGNRQCSIERLKTAEPMFMKCCQDQDYCNGNLPDVNSTDPKWKAPKEPNQPDPPIIQPESWQIKSLLVLIALFIIIYITTKLFKICLRCRKDPMGSNDSLKKDLDQFHHNIASVSASTHSYSISDDICRKTTSDPADSYIDLPEDLTSGIGEQMLNPRTMARAVGSGQTDHVGNGRFGRVFRGQYHCEDVAVKAFRTIDHDSWKREDTIFRSLNHENIVRFIASEVTPVDNGSTEIWMFLEYCPYGSLCDYLDQNEILGPQQAVKILYSIINGLNYLHEDYAQASSSYKPSIAHRDIKSKNILMKTPEICCIADFGHALVKVNEEALDYGKYNHLHVGTIRYMAPEILKPVAGLNYSLFATFAQADLYQYGLILWEVCHRTALDILHPAGKHKLPYDGVVPLNPDIQDMIKIVCEDQYRPPRYESWYKHPTMKSLADLMVECWRPNPRARMETLGVKKRMKEMHDIMTPAPHQLYLSNLLSERDKRLSEVTM